MENVKRYSPYQITKAGLTVITAHSGCEGTAPNSIEHIKAAIASGAEMIEVDVREHNGRLYLSHDIPENPDLRPGFETMLELISDYPEMRVNCDVKTEGLIKPVMECAAKHNMASRIVFTGAANDAMSLITSLGGELWYSLWNSDREQEEILSTEKICKDIDCGYINLQYKMVNDENTARLKAEGLRFSAWTADSEREIRRLLSLGIANITTRMPVLALRLRDEIQGTPESHGALPVLRISEAVRAAGRIVLERSGNAGKVDIKQGDSNFVTQTDVDVQEFLEARLHELMPEAGFFAEEDGQSENGPGEGFTFVIDPIDGTFNFMHGFSHSAVSVALLKDGEPVYGAIYDPYLDELYTAVKGEGAYLNGIAISAADRPADMALIAVGTAPYYVDELGDGTCRMTAGLMRKFGDIRRQGSAALDIAYVASGRCDAYAELRISPWDYAAGFVIASEAGVVSSDADGAPLRFEKPTSVIFSAPGIYEDVLDIVKKAK